MTAPRKCPSCTVIAEEIVDGERKLSVVSPEMIKVCPLGRDVGGFLWQCPYCKTIKADWFPLPTAPPTSESCPVCKGFGWNKEDGGACPECKGTGRIIEASGPPVPKMIFDPFDKAWKDIEPPEPRDSMGGGSD